jgi:hypothetical protein
MDKNQIAEKCGYRPGTKRFKAALMYLDGKGATQQQIAAKLGQPHLNMLRQLRAVHGKAVVQETKVEDKDTGREVIAYRIVPSKLKASATRQPKQSGSKRTKKAAKKAAPAQANA